MVAILDADKEGFLRSHRSLTQTAGRAARNVNGKVIFYADKITDSMRLTMDETAVGVKNSSLITRNMALRLSRLSKTAFPWLRRNNNRLRRTVCLCGTGTQLGCRPVVQYMNRKQLEKAIERTKKQMMEAAKKLDFIEAAQFRDELVKLEDLLVTKKD